MRPLHSARCRTAFIRPVVGRRSTIVVFGASKWRWRESQADLEKKNEIKMREEEDFNVKGPVTEKEIEMIMRVSDKLFPVGTTNWHKFWDNPDFKSWARKWRVETRRAREQNPDLPDYPSSRGGQAAWLRRSLQYLFRRSDFRISQPVFWAKDGVPPEEPTPLKEFDPDWDDWDFRAMMEKRRDRERSRREWNRRREEELRKYTFIDTISMDIRIPDEVREEYNWTEEEAWDVITQNGRAFDPRTEEIPWDEVNPDELPDWAGHGNEYIDEIDVYLKKTGLMVDYDDFFEDENARLAKKRNTIWEGLQPDDFEQALMGDDDDDKKEISVWPWTEAFEATSRTITYKRDSYGTDVPPPPQDFDVSFDMKTVEINDRILGLTRDVRRAFERMDHGGDETWTMGPGYQVATPNANTDPMLEASLTRLHEILKSKIHRVSHVNVATLLNQLGTLASASKASTLIANHPITHDLLNLVLEKVPQFESNHVANVIWAMASLGSEALHLKVEKSTGFNVMEMLLSHAIRIVASFTPQSISLLTFSLAKINFVGAREFASLLAVVAKPQLDGFTPRDAAVFLYGLALLEYEDHVALLPPLVLHLEASVEKFDAPQQVANVSWSLAKLWRDPNSLVSLLKRMESWSMERMEQFKALEMTAYVGSLPKLRFLPSKAFLEKLDSYLEPHFDDLPIWNCSSLFSASADFGHPLESLLKLLKNPPWPVSSAIHANVISILWSLSMLNQLTPRHMRWAASFLNVTPNHYFSEFRSIQLAQVFVTFNILYPDLKLGDIINPHLIEKTYVVWTNFQLAGELPSLTRRYSYSLGRLGYFCEVKLLESGHLKTSLVEHPSNGRRFAVEVDVVRRRFANAPEKFLGRSLWRRRVIEANGWPVLRIDLRKFPREHAAKQVIYLKAQIDRLFSDIKNENLNMDV